MPPGCETGEHKGPALNFPPDVVGRLTSSRRPRGRFGLVGDAAGHFPQANPSVRWPALSLFAVATPWRPRYDFGRKERGKRDGQKASIVIGLRRVDVCVAPSDERRRPGPGEAGRSDTPARGAADHDDGGEV